MVRLRLLGSPASAPAASFFALTFFWGKNMVGGEGAIARDGRRHRCNESTASTGDGRTHVETLGLSTCTVSTEESFSGGRIAEELANLCFPQQQEGRQRSEDRFGLGASPARVHGFAECFKPCRAEPHDARQAEGLSIHRRLLRGSLQRWWLPGI